MEPWVPNSMRLLENPGIVLCAQSTRLRSIVHVNQREAARELSNCKDDANFVAYNEIILVIKFVMDTKTFCLKMKPKLVDENWDLVVYSSSNWSGDVENGIGATARFPHFGDSGSERLYSF
jgi:hypothetical protein